MSNCCSKHIIHHEPESCSTTALKKAMPTASSISGMKCTRSQKTIEDVLNGVSGVESVEVDLNSNRVFLTGLFHVDNVINATEQAGYIMELIAASTGRKSSSTKAKNSGCCCR